MTRLQFARKSEICQHKDVKQGHLYHLCGKFEVVAKSGKGRSKDEQVTDIVGRVASQIRQRGIDGTHQTINISGIVVESKSHEDKSTHLERGTIIDGLRGKGLLPKGRLNPNRWHAVVEAEARKVVAMAYGSTNTHRHTTKALVEVQKDFGMLKQADEALAKAMRSVADTCLKEMLNSQEWAVNLAHRATLATAPHKERRTSRVETQYYLPIVERMSDDFFRGFHRLDSEVELDPADRARVQTFAVAISALVEGFAMRIRMRPLGLEKAIHYNGEEWTPFSLSLYAIAKTLFAEPPATPQRSPNK
jgi:hypothetical protein